MNYSKYIDHTILKPDCTDAQIKLLCEEAKSYNFASVCVNPGYIKMCAELLKDSGVDVCTVVGFPLGATSTESKVFETKQAVKDGATEIDMVINVSRLKEHDDEYVLNEIRAIRRACKGHCLKVIIETCYLSQEEKIAMCKAVTNAGADYIKTSTGFGTGGATMEDVLLMKANIGPNVKIKAAGGVSTIEDLENFLNAGCDRIGTSKAVALFKGETAKGY